jgi:hypothetical protein
MTGKEVRMRCIEALSSMGIREPGRIIHDAKQLEEWVNDADDKGEPKKGSPRGRPPKAREADKE